MKRLARTKAERYALIAALRRASQGRPSTTRPQKLADQLAYMRGLTEYSAEARRHVPTAEGRRWLDAADAFGPTEDETAEEEIKHADW